MASPRILDVFDRSARTIAARLRRAGAKLVGKPQKFYSADGVGALVSGEEERARMWGAELAAAFELGARVAREQLAAAVLDSPEVIYQHLAPQLQHLPHESLRVLLLDTRLRLAGTAEVSLGTVNETIAHPREILRPVIVRAAYGFVLVHNHPSGDPSPSSADRDLTRRVRDAAALMQVRFVDHLIIGRPAPGRSPWFSFREAGEV